MRSRQSDLAPLFPTGAVGGRTTITTGKVLAYADSGANTVFVNGVEVHNLPMLLAATVDLGPGAVVAVADTGGSYLILGRIHTPEE